MIRKFIYFSTPFFASLITFILLSRLTTSATFPTPSLIGLSTADAIIVLSQQNLHPHILEQREDSATIPGTVLEQSPRAGQQIKEKQTIFLVVSRAIIPPKAPDFTCISLEKAKKIAHNKQILIKNYPLHHIAPNKTILGQFPSAEEAIPTEGIILYSSQGNNNTPLITPDLQGLPLTTALEILKEKNITVQKTYKKANQKTEEEETVIAQKPLPGTIFFPNDSPKFQLEIT